MSWSATACYFKVQELSATITKCDNQWCGRRHTIGHHLGRIKQNNKKNAAQRGGCNPLNPFPGSASDNCYYKVRQVVTNFSGYYKG